jgi:hypothetical protein
MIALSEKFHQLIHVEIITWRWSVPLQINNNFVNLLVIFEILLFKYEERRAKTYYISVPRA